MQPSKHSAATQAPSRSSRGSSPSGGSGLSSGESQRLEVIEGLLKDPNQAYHYATLAAEKEKLQSIARTRRGDTMERTKRDSTVNTSTVVWPDLESLDPWLQGNEVPFYPPTLNEDDFDWKEAMPMVSPPQIGNSSGSLGNSRNSRVVRTIAGYKIPPPYEQQLARKSKLQDRLDVAKTERLARWTARRVATQEAAGVPPEDTWIGLLPGEKGYEKQEAQDEELDAVEKAARKKAAKK